MHLSLRASLVLLLLFCAGFCAAQPVANFTASPVSGCAPLIVQFTSTSTGTNASTTYSWNLGNSVTSSNQNPSTTYTNPGTYNITLTVSGPGGTHTITKTAYITVYPAPVVSFTASPTSGCMPLAVNFTSSVTPNAPGGVSYAWSFGDGFPGSGANPSHTYTYANTFNVTLSVTNSNGCATTVVVPAVTVFPKPGVGFSAPQTVFCSVPATVSFNNSPVSGVSYAWTFGDGSSGTGGNPTHTYNAAGTYTVTLIATDGNGCKDTNVQNAYITMHANNASYSAPLSACDSTYVPFTNTTAGVTGSTFWYFGDGSFDTGVNQSHIYYASNTYTVKMITKVGPCWDTVIKSIVINPKPVVSFVHDMPCLPGNMTFTATSSVPNTTYSWAWASGGGATGNPVTHFYNHCFVDTTYLLATSVAGCKDTIRMDTTFVQDWVPGVDYVPGGCAPRWCTFNSGPVATTCIPCLPTPTQPYPSYLPSQPCNYYHVINSFTWWVDGVLQSSTSPVMSFYIPTAGSHTVVLKTTTTNGCSRYDTFVACAGYKVPPSFYAYPDTVVCVKTPVWFKNTTGDSSITYNWYYGRYETDTNNGHYNGFHRYRYSKRDTVMLISEVCGCKDTAYGTINVLPGDAHFTDSVYCPPSKTVSFKNTSTGATTNYWDFGDGTTSTVANPPPHTYPAFNTTYYVRLMTSNSVTGCKDTCIDTVRFIPMSIGLLTDTTLCTGDTMHVTGSFSGLQVYGTRWTIDSAIYNFFPPYPPSYSFDTVLSVRGYHSVKWYVHSGQLGVCRDSVAKPNWVIVSHPIANFGASPRLGCTPLPVLFIDSTSYTPGTQSSSRAWTFGNGNSLTNNNATTSYIYPSAGKYSITLKVTDWIGCRDSITKTDYIEARHPVASFNPSKLSACIGEGIVFTNYSTGATGLHYQWVFGDGTGDTAKSVGHAYTAAGSYYVRLIAIDSTGCADTSITALPITVTHPTAGISLSDTLGVCPPVLVTFNSSSTTATGWDWNFGNGSTAIIQTPSSSYVAPGVYNVRLVVYDANFCTDTAYAHVRVLGYAGALSYSPLTGCAPLTVRFTANVTNVPRMVWDFSSGDTALVTTPTYSYTYRTPGVYVPKLIFYDGKGCSASSTGIDTIKVDDVIAGFKVMPPCERTPLTLIDTSHSLFSALASWRWDFGGGQIATGATTTRVYPAPGQYPVTLIVANARGCVDTISRNVTIFPLPVISTSPDTVVCPPDAARLTAYGGRTYAWTPAGTLSCNACITTQAAPTAPTTYVVSGTDSNGCMSTASVKVGIQTKTTFSVTSGGEICLGQRFHLAAMGATVYSWSPPASLTHPDSGGTFATPTATTTYIATGREGSCAADTHSVRVVVNPLPAIDAGTEERVVAGNAVALQASGSGIDHLMWNDDPTLSCHDCYGPYASPKVTTTYYVTAYTAKGCTSTDSVTVRVLCDGSQLFIPNAFTPNADGVNDYFFPRGKGIDYVQSFRIYSRWGELLYERTNMAVNDEYAGWNGTYNGRKLSPDVYVYIIEATCDNGSPIKWKGDVTLMQ